MYKIIVLKNSQNIDVVIECQKATSFFATHGINVQFSFRDINIPVDYKVYATVNGFNSITGQPMPVDYFGLQDQVKDSIRNLVKEGECSAVMFISDLSNIPSVPGKSYPNWTNWKPLYQNTDFIQIVFNPYLKQTGNTANAILHEPMHAFCYALKRYGYTVKDYMDVDSQNRPYFLNDQPENPLSNFGQTFTQIKPYLDKLVPTHKIYQYFSEAELSKWKLTSELWQTLDDSRALAGTPFIITSGLRTPEKNLAVGGKPNSAHLRGLAADIACSDNLKRTAILRGILGCGKPIFIEIAKAHIHLDLDSSIHRLGDTIISEDD